MSLLGIFTVVCNIRITNKNFTSLEWKSAYYIGMDKFCFVHIYRALSILFPTDQIIIPVESAIAAVG